MVDFEEVFEYVEFRVDDVVFICEDLCCSIFL